MAVIWAGRVLLFAGSLLVWQATAGTWLSTYWFSSPALIAGRLTTWVANGSLLSHTAFTLGEMAIGLAIGATTGITTGFLLGLRPRLAAVLEPMVIALYNIPKLALAPLFILWFGINMGPKIVLVALVTFFLMFINTLSGVRDVDQDLLNVMRIMGASTRAIIFKLLLPATGPWIRTGIKISIPYALTSAVAGEMIMSQKGLGFLVRKSADVLDMTGVYSALLVLIILGIIMDLAASGSWRSDQRWRHGTI